jgi:hypothetical protein
LAFLWSAHAATGGTKLAIRALFYMTDRIQKSLAPSVIQNGRLKAGVLSVEEKIIPDLKGQKACRKP